MIGQGFDRLIETLHVETKRLFEMNVRPLIQTRSVASFGQVRAIFSMSHPAIPSKMLGGLRSEGK
jgi:hypothetical protein